MIGPYNEQLVRTEVEVEEPTDYAYREAIQALKNFGIRVWFVIFNLIIKTQYIYYFVWFSANIRPLAYRRLSYRLISRYRICFLEIRWMETWLLECNQYRYAFKLSLRIDILKNNFSIEAFHGMTENQMTRLYLVIASPGF